jgi:hypothetical protein
MHRYTRSAVFALCFFIAVNARIQDQLELFFEFGPHEVVTKVEQPVRGQMKVEAVDTVFGTARTLTAKVPAVAADRLKREAEVSGVAVGEWATGPLPDEPDLAESRPDYLSEPRELRRNRLNYVLTQTAFSYYLYSVALPVAFDADPERAAALQILSLPAAFGTHYLIARNKDYHDAHLWSTDYFATNALALSYGLPLVLGGFNENSFRTGSILSAAAYPTSLWAGYKHGSLLLDDPGRVKLQSTFTYASAGLTYLAGMTLGPENADEEYVRFAMGAAIGGGIAGHYLSDRYRAGEAVPGGVGGGISTHTWLGLLAGLNLAILADVESGRTAGLLMLGGAATGFGHGLHFFKNRQDSYEQSRYNNYGTLGGMAIPLGVFLLAGVEPDEKVFLTAITAGAIGGYALTRQFTKNLVDKPREVKHSGHPGFSMNLMPTPEPYVRWDEKGTTQVAMRVKVPGLAYRF